MTAKRSLSSVVTVVVASVILFAIPIPEQLVIASTPGPPGPVSEPLIVPDGWTQTGTEDFDWVRSYFGQKSSLNRQVMRAVEGNPAWDLQSRPRTVVVDVLTTTNRASLGVYPESTLYRLSNTRSSDPLSAKLGHDVYGSLYTSVSDALLLTWTKLVFTWVRGDFTQRVTVISVDNHEPDADFPQPMPSMASNLGTSLAIFLRGNTIATDDDPDYKDQGLLTSFAIDLIHAQWGEN